MRRPFPPAGVPRRPAVSVDPFGWIARHTGPTALHRAIRYGGVVLFGAFLIRRITQYEDFALKPLWAVETLIYAALLSAFLMRVEPVERSSGWRDIAIPLIGAVLPFALLTSAPHPAIAADPLLVQIVFWWMTVASAITVWGVWTLRRAFSITVEARELVASGPYRWVRHPIYLGEIVTAGAVATWRFSWINVAVLVLFATIQLVRARLEERKLARWFPQYTSLLGWWFWRV
jgi:protein-S-isoprenylcysteine O-methyltransferase Ste14